MGTHNLYASQNHFWLIKSRRVRWEKQDLSLHGRIILEWIIEK